MKILFLVKFYEPFDRGGSEWSTHDLAKLLVAKGHKVTILTPNYGAERKEKIDGIVVKRFPFFKKLKNPKGEITPWWTSNIVWFFYTSLICTLLVKKEEFDVIHVHSNEFLPAAVIAGAIIKKATVATFRDYQSICSFGFCLWHKQKACNLTSYFRQDFDFFYRDYVTNKNQIKYLILFLAAIRSWIITKLLFYFASKVKYKVAVSKQLATIFNVNGLKNMQVIHNPVIITSKLDKHKDEITLAPQALKKLSSAGNEISYIGKLSKGKGIDLLFEIIPQILKKIPQIKFQIIGSGHLEKVLKIKAKKIKGQKIIFLGQMNHKNAIEQIKKASLVVIPSIWPEPLPRSAIETVLSGIPVVATNVGGLKEVVKNNVYGILCKPESSELEQAVVKGFMIKDTLRKNIVKDLAKLKKHFAEDVLRSYEKIYQQAYT